MYILLITVITIITILSVFLLHRLIKFNKIITTYNNIFNKTVVKINSFQELMPYKPKSFLYSKDSEYLISYTVAENNTIQHVNIFLPNDTVYNRIAELAAGVTTETFIAAMREEIENSIANS